MLTLLTATGCRPKAWALCERWMMAQTYTGPVNWIVVDDGEEAQPVTFNRAGWLVSVVRPEPFWKQGQNTQARNLLAGLDLVEPEAWLVCIEDDDWYSPRWLDTVCKHLKGAELVGENFARYYNTATKRGRQLGNAGHASLCATAMRGGAIQTFRKVCRMNEKFIDLKLWQQHKNRMLFSGSQVVGIKGLPGRDGIGMGHKPEFRGIKDEDGSLLREWIGTDAEFYQ